MRDLLTIDILDRKNSFSVLLLVLPIISSCTVTTVGPTIPVCLTHQHMHTFREFRPLGLMHFSLKSYCGFTRVIEPPNKLHNFS